MADAGVVGSNVKRRGSDLGRRQSAAQAEVSTVSAPSGEDKLLREAETSLADVDTSGRSTESTRSSTCPTFSPRKRTESSDLLPCSLTHLGDSVCSQTPLTPRCHGRSTESTRSS